MELYHVDLPAPSEQLVALAKKIILTNISYANPEFPKWLNDWHGNDTNSVANYFGNYLESMELTTQIKLEYSKYFPGVDLGSYYGCMRGDYDTSGELKSQPPHVDGSRNINLNCYIDLGGDDVQTWFYDVFGPSDRNGPVHYKKSEMNSVGYYKFDTDQWYFFNGNQCHSVENIKADRYFFAITFLDQLSDKRKKLSESDNLKNKFINPSVEGRSAYTIQDILNVLNSVGIASTQLQLTNV